jgi:hypothetical protein
VIDTRSAASGHDWEQVTVGTSGHRAGEAFYILDEAGTLEGQRTTRLE